MTQLEKMLIRWRKATGESMPHAITRLSIDRITRAVELAESGQTVFVPGVSVSREPVADEISDWDKHGEF